MEGDAMNRSRQHRGIAAVVLILIIIGTAVASAGCGSQANAAGDPVKLTDADNGKAVTVKAGDTVQVILAGNPTTGYSWSTTLSDKDAAVLQQRGEAVYAQESTDPSLVGGGGTFAFTFKAAAPGQVVLKFDYARPWETGGAPIQTYSVTVTVK
jgi:inhibitor of cysteine peptidase